VCGVWVVGSQLPGPTARFCVSFVEYAVVCAYGAFRSLAHPLCSMRVLIHGAVRSVCECTGVLVDHVYPMRTFVRTRWCVFACAGVAARFLVDPVCSVCVFVRSRLSVSGWRPGSWHTLQVQRVPAAPPTSLTQASTLRHIVIVYMWALAQWLPQERSCTERAHTVFA